ncbi:hypothetical protein TTHERM_000009919 (macronuclear) [Tetrahymena thermophila SB210]|uniref:Oxalate/formate antiporter protein n=1 Tax=Tetrahymena thermophila (strain SB210) TaxID=312017 RepID=W7XGY3_TETTS|nr:hypothetical protein TTHERM_000009919 [Tetrahymena thermophila SB210]EWS76323.1 hypothetical protein TTHERM_000009919 [Tetrahymena thermophila SB210]|eukprot:XP_012651107.1 hypothetical protein TTHERM_000009919 [Tetrahymena thermophila SB210]
MGASGLGIGLAKCINLSNLTLNLENELNKFTYYISNQINQIGDEGASGLGSCLTKCINLSNLTLNLRRNQIGAMGALGLCSGLVKSINLSI